MGRSHDEFVKYPRTPHLFGSRGTDDDKHLAEAESLRFLADESLIVEEKLDGTNVGLHFSGDGKLSLQCRGHLITEGMHPQYDLFKQWAVVNRPTLEDRLGDGFILFGEWMYARHSIHYRRLPHYFFEFDIYDKGAGAFLDFDRRMAPPRRVESPDRAGAPPGSRRQGTPRRLVGPSLFDARFEDPTTGQVDGRMEGLYLRTEAGGVVTGRAKFVRPEFVEKIKRSAHGSTRP